MHLLQYNDDGEFSLTQFFDNIPRYAILSHTWEQEEVTFKDIMQGNGASKTGFDKIRFCGEQARRDRLQYFWVDTCCIDKSSSAELQEAINSMFRWYQNAAKCYVYLSDVWARKRKASDLFSEYTWESAFRGSRWFTRGWTLQELLAPNSVEFFSREGKRLGDKRALERQIHQITKIPITGLQGTPLSQFDVETRFLWAENRQTTREEDKAYSLFGIFDIQIPLLYGEGKDKALKRLREEIDKPLKGLDCLPFATDAPFNSFDRQDELTCLPNTRVNLLQEIYDWADRQDERCIFWLNGLAGTGKSTIARTVARKYLQEERLGASFFFLRGSGDVSHAGKFFTSIAVQLANNVPSLRQYIYNAITKHKDIASQSLRDQWYQLILHPLSRLGSGLSPPSYVLIVDALDECDKEEHIRIILQLLAEARTLETVRLRVFLTSRPEIPIRHGFSQIPNTERQDFVLHNISPSIVDHDISIFLRYNLNFIAGERSLGASWPGKQIIERLVYNASGLFIWAATACRFIREGKQFATNRLDIILESSSTTINAPEKHLNKIYLSVLRHSISPDYTAKEVEELRCTLKSLLGSVVTLFSPLSTQSLSSLIDTSQGEVVRTLDDLHAILDIPKDVTCPLRLHHPSFRDFLLNIERCDDPNFQVDEKQAHQRLANSCIQLMSKSLKQDVCGQEAPEIRYACLYWIQHLQKSDAQLYDNDQVHQFLEVHLLHWLEALGWMGKTSEGILAIASLEYIALTSKCPRLYAFIHDVKRFVLYSHLAIEQTPGQVHCSAIVFAPTNSIVRQLFIDRIPRWIQRLPEVPSDWGAALQTLEGHSSVVNAVVFSPDSKQLASASIDKTVRLWDAATGASLQTLEGHSDFVKEVAFSPDGKQLASASDDKTIRLWDPVTGAVLHMLEANISAYFRDCPFAFSPDSKRLVSVLQDKKIRLWDTAIGAALRTIEGHSDHINALAFSRDGKQLVSASRDKTVRLWDADTGATLRMFEGHESAVVAVALSPDMKHLASASYDGVVQLWEAVRASLQMLGSHSAQVNAVAFSPDSKLLASASDDRTVRLWQAATGASPYTLDGHSKEVKVVAFSPDGKQLASASKDRTVRLWDAVTGSLLQTLEGHLESVNAVAFSPDSKQLASASNDDTVRLWDIATRVEIQAPGDHVERVTAVTFSPKGQLLASASLDNTVKLWDTVTGRPVQTLKGHTDAVMAVAFSLDSKLLASASADKTINLWDAITGECKLTLKDHTDSVMAVAFSPDGKQLVSASCDATVKVWDLGTGAAPQTLEGHTDWISAVAVSPDGKHLASASWEGEVWLWNAAKGAGILAHEGHTDVITTIAFSPDSNRLASASNDRTLRLWDVATGVALMTLEVGEVLQAFSFSVEGPCLEWDRGLLAVPTCSIFARGIFVKEHWVALGMNNLLWLPPDYRPSCATVHGNIVAIGNGSGRVSILKLAF